MKDLNRRIALYCDICGNDQFSTLSEIACELSEAPDEIKVQCSDCGKMFSKKELIEVNQPVINANIEELKKDAIKEFEKDLTKALKKWR